MKKEQKKRDKNFYDICVREIPLLISRKRSQSHIHTEETDEIIKSIYKINKQ